MQIYCKNQFDNSENQKHLIFQGSFWLREHSLQQFHVILCSAIEFELYLICWDAAFFLGWIFSGIIKKASIFISCLLVKGRNPTRSHICASTLWGKYTKVCFFFLQTGGLVLFFPPHQPLSFSFSLSASPPSFFLYLLDPFFSRSPNSPTPLLFSTSSPPQSVRNTTQPFLTSQLFAGCFTNYHYASIH